MEAINLFNGCDYTDIFFLGPPDLYNDYNSTFKEQRESTHETTRSKCNPPEDRKITMKDPNFDLSDPQCQKIHIRRHASDVPIGERLYSIHKRRWRQQTGFEAVDYLHARINSIRATPPSLDKQILIPDLDQNTFMDPMLAAHLLSQSPIVESVQPLIPPSSSNEDIPFCNMEGQTLMPTDFLSTTGSQMDGMVYSDDGLEFERSELARFDSVCNSPALLASVASSFDTNVSDPGTSSSPGAQMSYYHTASPPLHAQAKRRLSESQNGKIVEQVRRSESPEIARLEEKIHILQVKLDKKNCSSSLSLSDIGSGDSLNFKEDHWKVVEAMDSGRHSAILVLVDEEQRTALDRCCNYKFVSYKCAISEGRTFPQKKPRVVVMHLKTFMEYQEGGCDVQYFDSIIAFCVNDNLLNLVKKEKINVQAFCRKHHYHENKSFITPWKDYLLQANSIDVES
eukprot:TRINITY_DN325_c0_g1_i3.p1 TRINITY_DN325_c0_g1~~TRINITY_DN325_c0_g1_i3.p1  ORF type:complete len:454 (-),score=54.15 TRINITY_DN325_c0_g1_i3:209-1570(-)